MPSAWGQGAGPTQRIPNTDEADAFPRWMPFNYLFIEPSLDGDPRLFGTTRDIALDRKGNVHVIALGRDEATGDQLSVIYANNRWETRRKKGFSAGFKLKGHPQSPAQQTAEFKGLRIAASPTGKVAVSWQENMIPADPGAVLFKMYVRILDPETGMWGMQTQVVSDSAGVGDCPSGTEYSNPYLYYDAQDSIR
jgi:hypothetical protein